jgi:hypothetical protein
MKANRTFRRNFDAERSAELKPSPIKRLRHPTPVKAKGRSASPLRATETRGAVVRPVKGGSLFASHIKDSLRSCYRSLDQRRRLPKAKPEEQVDLAEMIRAIENSPMKTRVGDSRRGSRQSYLRRGISDYQQASTDQPSIRQASYSPDAPRVFLTNVPVQSSYSISNLPNSKTTPYSSKLESLKASCSFQLTQRRHSNKRLSLEDEALTSKIGTAKALFEQSRDFPSGYIEQEIAEFHKEKLAFVYGKHNKGKYVGR